MKNNLATHAICASNLASFKRIMQFPRSYEGLDYEPGGHRTFATLNSQKRFQFQVQNFSNFNF